MSKAEQFKIWYETLGEFDESKTPRQIAIYIAEHDGHPVEFDMATGFVASFDDESTVFLSFDDNTIAVIERIHVNDRGLRGPRPRSKTEEGIRPDSPQRNRQRQNYTVTAAGCIRGHAGAGERGAAAQRS